MSRFSSFILLSFLCAGVATHAAAQQPDVPPGVEPDTTPVETSAPYDDKLMRLAEVLGSIHKLRNLCGANEGNKWRDQMGKLIATEEPGPRRRAQMIARFNRGYNGFDETYSTCTPSALLAADRYRKEGVLLASQINSRYGR
ncbi:MAG: TIGR02301 family protein [Pseudomonadota bacterium]